MNLGTKIGLFGAVLISFAIAWPAEVRANGIESMFEKPAIHGKIRNFMFIRNYQCCKKDQWSFSGGGQLHLETGLKRGFGTAVTWYLADDFGLDNPNPKLVDATLPAYNVNTYGELYLRYQGPGYALRLGRQLLNAPWGNPADSRMIPATFQGFGGNVNIGSLSLSAYRMYRWKSRISQTFQNTTAITSTPSPGFLTFGATEKTAHVTAQAWFYDFYDIAALLHTDVRWTLSPFSQVKPYVGAQYTRERPQGTKLVGSVDAKAFGAIVGLARSPLDVYIAYNNIPASGVTSAYNGGDFASPYTFGTADDPLYTSSIATGLVGIGTGHAYKVGATYWLDDRHWRIIASDATFTPNHVTPVPSDTTTEQNTTEQNFDMTYFVRRAPASGTPPGLSVRYRLARVITPTKPLVFTYNRFMFEYVF